MILIPLLNIPKTRKEDQCSKVGTRTSAKVFHQSNTFIVCQSAATIVEHINDLVGSKLSNFIAKRVAVEHSFTEHPHLLQVEMREEKKIFELVCVCFDC